MAEAQLRPDTYPVDNDMMRAFIAREYNLDKVEVARDYTDARINIVMRADSRFYERWRRGAKRQHYGI